MNETDRELLELAAKAAGIEYHAFVDDPLFGTGINIGEIDVPLWNPLTNDGDALRLAVKLNIGVMSAEYTGRTCAWLYCKGRAGEFFEPHGTDPQAAARRAIVRAAAEIGRSRK
jgi:hypothetical protein